MSAEVSARSVRQANGLDPVRALQRVLYRSAKQDRPQQPATPRRAPARLWRAALGTQAAPASGGLPPYSRAQAPPPLGPRNKLCLHEAHLDIGQAAAPSA